MRFQLRESGLVEERFRDSDSRIEVHVAHRQGFLEHVPESLLSVHQEQERVPRQFRLRELLGYGNLELDVGVGLRRRLVWQQRGADGEVIVLIQTEIWAVVEFVAKRIDKLLLVFHGDYLRRCRKGGKQRSQCHCYGESGLHDKGSPGLPQYGQVGTAKLLKIRETCMSGYCRLG